MFEAWLKFTVPELLVKVIPLTRVQLPPIYNVPEGAVKPTVSEAPFWTRRLPVTVISPLPLVTVVVPLPEPDPMVRLLSTIRVLELFLKIALYIFMTPYTLIFWFAPVPPSPSQVPPDMVMVLVVPEVPTVTDLELVSVSKMPADWVSMPPLARAKLLVRSCSVPAPEWVKL